jgi:hypothetical protein
MRPHHQQHHRQQPQYDTDDTPDRVNMRARLLLGVVQFVSDACHESIASGRSEPPTARDHNTNGGSATLRPDVEVAVALRQGRVDPAAVATLHQFLQQHSHRVV